jgi:hypothetical protein
MEGLVIIDNLNGIPNASPQLLFGASIDDRNG